MTKLVLLSSAVLATALISQSRSCAEQPHPSQVSLSTPPVTAQYAQINDAILTRNVDKIMSYFTDDFTEVNSAGATVNRDQERKDYQDEFGKIKSMDVHYTIQDVEPTANGTYCEVKFHMDGVGFKKILFVKVQGTFTNDLMVRDLWVPTSSGWRLKSRQCLLNETKVAAN